MNSYPQWEQVEADLGDKIVAAVSKAVTQAREDLQSYRRSFPLWVAQATERGLASWIHDRMWAHLAEILDAHPDVVMVDHEPQRELSVRTQYVMRLKRHHEDGSIRTYPTPAALDFLIQLPQPSFEGMEKWNLIAGYVWKKETREVGSPTISLRSDRTVIWKVDLDAGTITEHGVSRPIKSDPTPPAVEMRGDEEGEQKRSEDEQ